MSKRLYVGIDVSNAKLDVSFLDDEERTVRPLATYRNDPDGWVELRAAIVSAASLCGKRPRVVCGMESTGNMHKRVEQALRGEKRRKLEVHVLNPRAIKHFSKALLKDAKTDRIDSHQIAQFLVRMKDEPVVPPPEGLEELRELTRSRRKLIEERTTAKNRLHKLLRYHLPGYRSVLGKSLNRGLLVVLQKMPSPHLIQAQSPEQIAAIRKGARHLVGDAFARKLLKLAAQAPSQQLRKGTQWLLRSTAQRVLELTDQLTELDAVIEETLDELFPDQVLTSIPGLGKVSAAAILAEIGDIRRFDSKTRFIGYCGLYPIVWQSGEAKRRYRMTFKGNKMLKMTLLVASAAARQYNPVIAAFYERKRRGGKSTKAAGGAIARKLAEIVFTLLLRGEPWSPEKAVCAVDKAQVMAEAA